MNAANFRGFQECLDPRENLLVFTAHQLHVAREQCYARAVLHKARATQAASNQAQCARAISGGEPEIKRTSN
jgi:hypothetical protein